MVGINLLVRTIRNWQIMIGNQRTRIHEVTFQGTVISVLILFFRIRLGLSVFYDVPIFIPICTLDVLLY